MLPNIKRSEDIACIQQFKTTKIQRKNQTADTTKRLRQERHRN